MNATRIIEKELQMNEDERRYKLVTELGAAHHKGRKKRKAQLPCGTRMTWIHRIFANPCKSVFYHNFSCMKSTDGKVSVFTSVYPCFLNSKLPTSEQSVILRRGAT